MHTVLLSCYSFLAPVWMEVKTGVIQRQLICSSNYATPAISPLPLPVF